MSVFNRLRRLLSAPAVLHDAHTYGRVVASPLSRPHHLAHVVAPDWFPDGIDRATAMRVPAVARARLIIVTAIAGTQLWVTGPDRQRLTNQPSWVNRTSGPISPYHRMLWTVDDLLFYGMSLWAVERDGDGNIVAADRVPWDAWSIQNDSIVYTGHADGQPTVVVDPRSVILIPGNDDGLLEHGVDAIAAASGLLRTAGRAAQTPSAYLELHQTNDVPLTDPEVDALIARWARARNGENGGVAFTSAGIEVRELGAYGEHLLIEGRNAAVVDVARAIGIPGTLLDAVTQEGMTYQNADAKQADLATYGLNAYMRPIAARLGLDDVVAPGQAVEFDTPVSPVSVPDDDAPSTARPTLRSVVNDE